VPIKAEGVPRFGVTKVGLVPNTAEPVPVSSVRAVASCEEVNEPRRVEEDVEACMFHTPADELLSVNTTTTDVRVGTVVRRDPPFLLMVIRPVELLNISYDIPTAIVVPDGKATVCVVEPVKFWICVLVTKSVVVVPAVAVDVEPFTIDPY
jgi:hypothetical protein